VYFGNEYFVVRWNNCILRVVRHTSTYYIRVKNNQVNESLGTFVLWKHMLVRWLLSWKFWTITAGWSKNRHVQRNVASVPNLSWTEMAFLNAVSSFENFFPIK
jgi:hypothetical protein